MHRAPCDEGLLQSGSYAECEEEDKPWVLAATIGGSSLAFIVGSVVNVALPAIQRGLGATVAEMQWVLNAYLLLLGALILVGGSAGDRFGRRRLFVAGTVVFTLASVGCGVAPTTGWLIGARAVQGVGAALLVPNSLAIISAAFSGAERGKAIGTWAGFSALTTALGPVLGGWLVDALSWRWVFFVVVPVALVTLGIALWKVPESRDAEASSGLDGIGASLAAASFGTLTYGLIASGERGWDDALVLATLIGAVLLFGLFLLREARAPNPMMPLDLFRSPTFSGANVVTLGLYFALNGVLFFLPFNLILVQGYSATAAGAAFLPFSLVVGLLSRPAGGLVERFGARPPLVVGPLVAGAGLALLMVPAVGGTYWTTFFPPLLVLGIGMAIAVAPLTTVVMDSVDEAHVGTASGVNNAASRIAGLLAIAILGVVALGIFNTALDEQLALADVPSQTEALLEPFRSDLTGADLPDAVQGERREQLQALVNGAFVVSFRWVAGIAAALAVLSALVAAFTIRPVTEPPMTESDPSTTDSMPATDPHADQPVLTSGAPLGEARAAMLLLHGRGASAQNILMLAAEFGREDLAYLAPQAAGSSWYPYSFLARLEQNEPKLSSALRTVGRVLEEIEAKGIPPERVVLAGFSQGACLASEYAARNPRRYGGVVVLSGGLIGREQLRAADPPADKLLDYDGDLGGTPVFLGCSDEDPHIPLVRVEHSAEALGRLGADVTMQIYPGMGHTVNDDEIEHVRRLLDHRLPTA